MYVCIYLYLHVCIFVCLYVCMYVLWMYVVVYVCMYGKYTTYLRLVARERHDLRAQRLANAGCKFAHELVVLLDDFYHRH